MLVVHGRILVRHRVHHIYLYVQLGWEFECLADLDVATRGGVLALLGDGIAMAVVAVCCRVEDHLVGAYLGV